MITIAAATALETVRRRVAVIAVVVSLALAVGVGWGFHRLAEAIHPRTAAIGTESVLTILLAFAFSVALAVGAAFLAAPSIAGDIESGTALAILPRPISRTAYVCGKWLGLAVLVSVYAALSGALALAAITLGSGYRAPNEFQALGFLVAQSVALLTLALALSTRLSPLASGIVPVALFGVAWICGITSSIARGLGATVLAHATAAVNILIPTDGLWRGAVYELTPVALLVAEAHAGPHGVNPFGVDAPPPAAFVAWSVLWIAALLVLAVVSMRARNV